MSTKSTGPKGAPLFVRILLLLLLLILMLLLVAYAALRSVPPEALRQLLGMTTTPSATAVVSAPSTPTLPSTPSPTSTPVVIVGTVPIEETVTPVSAVTVTVTVAPTSTPEAVVVMPSPTRPSTATPTLIPLTVVPSPTVTWPATATPTATPTPLRLAVTPSASPVGAEVGIVAEEVSPTVVTAAPPSLTPLPPPTVPPLIVPRVTIAEVMRNGDFSGEFLRGGVASEWEVFHNGAATFWCYPDTLRTITGEVLRSQTLHIHGADLPDRYLGIYQTVDVVPGGVYTFTIAGLVRTPQGDVQQTGYGYRMQVGFDPRGGNNWQDVDSWIELPWDEQPRDRPSHRTEVFTTNITASQPQLTVFIRAWKKWADAGEGMYDITRVSLVGPVVTMVPPAPAAIVPPTLPSGITPLVVATPSLLPPSATPTSPTPLPGATPLAVVTPAPLPPSATPAPPALIVSPTPPPMLTPPAAAALPTPAVPVTGDTLLTLWDAQRTAITALLVVLLLLGGLLYHRRPWSQR